MTIPMKKILFALLFVFTALWGNAQDVTIASGDFNTCNESLNDTNPIGPYGPNENETLTVCPDGDETILNIYFISFGLGAGDTLTIYNGGDVFSPVIGEYTGTALSNANITSDNPQGCLTLQWTSDATEQGDFGAIFYCGPPCYPPVVAANIINDSGNPLKICQGETVTLDATPTSFFEGTTLQSFEWDFGDGTTDNTSWPTVSHTYPSAGSYRINLRVTDNNGCSNFNILDQLVYVSTTPVFTLTATPPVICPGTSSSLVGQVSAVTFVNSPTADLGEPLYIPDAGTQDEDCFYDTIFVSGFSSGATIQSADDIDSLFASMEHTYLTDITIAFICPDGSALSVYSQGGGLGNVDLGFPITADDGEPGEGLNYYWSPDATNPNWNNISGTDFVNPGGTDGGGYVEPGVYQSIDPWDNLVGCPINGPWIIRVCDVVGADDGWIFNWGIFFDPSLFPEDLTFTPVFDANCTSTFWSGPALQNDADCDNAEASPTNAGNNVYTYTAIDDFGCTYTATANVNVVPVPDASAGGPYGFCGEPITLNGDIPNAVNGQQYTYTWSPADLFDDATDSDPLVSSLETDTTVTLLVSWNVNPEQCFDTVSTQIFLPSDPVAFPDSSFVLCLGEITTLFNPLQAPQTEFEWYYSTNPILDDEDELIWTNSTIEIDTAGYYIALVRDPFCFDEEQTVYNVTPGLCLVSAPTAFSPNTNGKNNELIFPGLEFFPASTLQVYNRWGTIIYESSDYQNNWAPADTDASDGTYYYILGINRTSGFEYRNGTITIFR